MRKLITRNLSGKRIFTLFLLTGLVYLIMLIVTIPEVMRFSGGMKLPDMMPTGYDPDYIQKLFSTLGAEGRGAYLYRQMPLDLIYPGLFAVSFSLLIAFFLNRLNRLDGSLFYLCFFPVLGGVFDYLENFSVISMINRYPEFSAATVNISSLFSILKSVFVSASFLALIGCLVALVFKRFATR